MRKFMKLQGTHQCQECGWAMTDEQFMSIMFDLGCPRCGRSFWGFGYTKPEEALNENHDLLLDHGDPGC
uniref:Uncharacterized protein n=1 Tax=viral metagenome TaxID=1070528 RepID=A0A6H1ZK97_9ZZZZ